MKQIPKLEDIKKEHAVECWVSIENKDKLTQKVLIWCEDGRGYLAIGGGLWNYATPCVSPLEAIEGKQVVISNEKEFKAMTRHFDAVWADPMLEDYPINFFNLGWTNKNQIHLETISFQDFIKLPNNPAIEAPKVEMQNLDAIDLIGKYVTFGDKDIGSWINTFDVRSNTVYIGINDEWRDAEDVTHYLNDQGEWVDAVKQS